MLTASKFFEWIREIVEGRARSVSSSVIYVSEASACLRRSYYERVYGRRLTELQLVSILIGSGVHRQLQELLRGKGWRTEVEVRQRLEGFMLVGHVDAYKPDEGVVLEIKTVSRAPDRPYREHARQINSYLVMTGARTGYLIYIAMNGAVRVFHEVPSKRLWNEVVERALYLHHCLRRGRLPQAERSALCMFCAWRWECMNSGGGRDEDRQHRA